MPEELTVVRAGSRAPEQLLALFDDALAWLVARGQTGQWGSQPFSAQPAQRERIDEWARGELWFAVPSGDLEADPAGAMLLGEHMEYVPAPDRPELYVKVLLTASDWRGHGVGQLLVDHAVAEARSRGAEQLRVDCWDGVPELPAQYERLGFTRVGSFVVNPPGRGDWHGAILAMQL